jgi:Na+-translocating ferredoxin:NAD+ oxidoreductase RnfD subunit
MQTQSTAPDPRYFQVIFQAIFLLYGLIYLHWQADWLHYALSIFGCLLFSYATESVRQKRLPPFWGKAGFNRWGFSVLISAMSLCLLLKTNDWTVSLLAAFLTVASKSVFRYRQKHIFNPSTFGIVATLLLTEGAWLSPAQWGSNTVIFFFVATLGTIVVTRVQKLDVSLAFLLTYVGLLYWRQVGYLGWPTDHFIHAISTGSLLLFSFFMISDPKTAPDHPFARIVWAVLIAAVAFYLSVFKWQYNTVIWVLVAAAPLVPLLDRFFKAERFQWENSSPRRSSFRIAFSHPLSKKLVATVLLVSLLTYEALAFCGFYVSKADGTLKNKTSQVILVRDGNKNVITMYNDFKGALKDFAMVVPVPVVLQKNDIKVVEQSIFKTLNDYSQPRLVEYYDENPCETRVYNIMDSAEELKAQTVAPPVQMEAARRKVTIEAKYLVGEYDILILSAKESEGLKLWLDENGYKIPKGAEDVLEPYIRSNLKFFVVKVNEAEMRKLGSDFLRPIQIRFNSPKFMLPIRLGMANADGDQDMIVYGFSKKGRIECINYRTVEVPTGKNIPLFIKNNFSSFYTNLFQHQWQREGKSVAMLEYAWDVSPKNFLKCDPCVAEAPSQQDLVQAGVWWMNPAEAGYSNAQGDNVFFTRLHVRYNRTSFPQDLVFQVTPNSDNFQARYIVTHPATGDLNCKEGKRYVKTLKERRQNEMEMLGYLTGKNHTDWDLTAAKEERVPEEALYASSYPQESKETPTLLTFLGISLLLTIALHYRFKK